MDSQLLATGDSFTQFELDSQQFLDNQSNVSESTEAIEDYVNRVNKGIFPNGPLTQGKTYHYDPIDKSLSNRLLSCRFDPSGSFVASGCEDGIIRIISMNTNTLAYSLQDSVMNNSPVTCLRWRPMNPSDSVKNSLLATYGNGQVLYWHSTSIFFFCIKDQVLVRLSEEAPVSCCDYSCEGLRFATGGYDCKVRVYDAGRLKPVAVHTEPGEKAPIHTNRIFCLKHHSSEPFTLFSAGWDKQVIIWDLRTRQAQAYIYGPMVCGDALDQNGHYLLTGSFRDDNQLEVWDVRTLGKVSGIKWQDYVKPPVEQRESNRSAIYSCCFDKTGQYIYAGTVGTKFSEIRAFDVKDGFRCCDSICVSSKGILSIDYSKKYITYSLADGTQGLIYVQ